MRVQCICGSTVFHLHVPPKKTRKPSRAVYLLCQACGKVWRVKFGALLEVDDQGVLKPYAEAKLREVEAHG